MSNILDFDKMSPGIKAIQFRLGGKDYTVPDFSEERLERLAQAEIAHEDDTNPYPGLRAKLAILTDSEPSSFEGVQVDALLTAVATLTTKMTEAAEKNVNRRTRRSGRGR